MAREVKINIVGDASKFRAAVNDAEVAADGLGSKLGRGIGAVGKAFAGAAVTGVGVFAAAVGSGLKDLVEVERLAGQTEAVIKSTGGAAGVSAGHVADYADAIERTTGVQAESIVEASNLLLTFTNLKNGVGEGNDVFDQTVQVAADMGVALGTDAASQAVALGKALNDPIAGIAALTRVGVTFTDDQKDMIAALVETGDVMGAQKLILAELNKEFGGSAQAFGDTTAGKIEKLKNSFGNLTEQLAASLLPALNGALSFVTERLIPGIESLVKVFQDEGLAGVWDRVADWWGDAWPTIQAWLVDFVKSIGDWIVDNGPKIAAKLVEWGKALVEWVLDAAPKLLEQLASLIQRLFDWVYENREQIAAKLVEWGKAFVQWVVDVVPPLLAKLGELLLAIGTWIVTDAAPKLIVMALELAKALTEWVVTDALPWLVQKLGELAGALLGWVGEQVAALPGLVAELAAALLGWVGDAAAAAPGKLAEVAGKVWEWVSGVIVDMPGQVAGIVTAFWTWITDIVTAIPAKLGEITATIAEWAGKIPAVVASAAAGAFDLLFDGFKAAWDSVASVINRGIDVFNRLPGPDLPNVPTFATFGSVTSHLNQGGGGGLHVGIGTDPSLHAPAGTKMMALGGFLPVGGNAIVGEAGTERIVATPGGVLVTPLGGAAGQVSIVVQGNIYGDQHLRDVAAQVLGDAGSAVAAAVAAGVAA